MVKALLGKEGHELESHPRLKFCPFFTIVLSQFLLLNRVTPHEATGIVPGEILFNRKLRTILDLVIPFPKEKQNLGEPNEKLTKRNFDSRGTKESHL